MKCLIAKIICRVAYISILFVFIVFVVVKGLCLLVFSKDKSSKITCLWLSLVALFVFDSSELA